jgi:hypothetical protein
LKTSGSYLSLPVKCHMHVGVLLHWTCGASLSGSVRIETYIRLGYHYVWFIMLGVKALPIRPEATTTTSQTILPEPLDIQYHAVRILLCIPQQPWETTWSPCSIPSKITCLVRSSASAQEPLPWIPKHSSPSSCLDFEVDTFADQF